MKKKHEELVQKNINFQINDIDEDNYIIRGVFSTEDEDRHGEIVDQAGWKIDTYMTNPVVLFGHDHYTPAVGQMIELKVDPVKKALVGAIKFAAEEFELARTLYKLYKGRYMRAFSAGFRNEKQEIVTDAQGNEQIVLRVNELMEVSCVNVPANAMALASSKGIDVSSIKQLNKKKVKRVSLSQKTIERISDSLTKKLENVLRADVAVKEVKKVETPVGKGSHKKGFISTRQINKTMRQLLREKKLISKID